MKLNFKIDKLSKTKLYIQLYEKMKEVILEGEFSPNEKLPSVRQLIQRFSLNSSTILKAYELLDKDGFIYKISGSGTYLKDFSKDNDIFEKNLIIDSIQNNKLDFLGKQSKKIIDFGSSYPNKELFPLKEFQESINKVLNSSKEDIFEHHDIQGYHFLRKIIARNFQNSFEEISYNNIQITSGNQQSLNLIKNAIVKPNSTIVVSHPTSSSIINLFKGFCRVESINLLDDGFDMFKFENLLERVSIDFVYVSTNFQNPTSIKWSYEKKLQLLQLAKDYDFIIIEEDFLSNLSYQNKSISSLKTLDRHQKVIYIKDYSKIIMPGINIGYMVLPENLVSKFIDSKFSLDISTSGLHQRILTHLLNDDEFLDTHIEKLKYIYKKRLDIMIKELNKVHGLDIRHYPTGGIYIWVRIPNFINTQEFYSKLKHNKVLIIPGDTFYSDKNKSIVNLKQIRLSIASVKEEDIKEGIEIIKETLNSFEGNKSMYNSFIPII